MRVLSGQSFVLPHVESLPFEERLVLNAPLKRFIGGQELGDDLSPLQQEIQERPLGIRERQHGR